MTIMFFGKYLIHLILLLNWNLISGRITAGHLDENKNEDYQHLRMSASEQASAHEQIKLSFNSLLLFWEYVHYETRSYSFDSLEWFRKIVVNFSWFYLTNGLYNIRDKGMHRLSSTMDGNWMKRKTPFIDSRLMLPSSCAEATAFTKHSGFYYIKSPKSPNATLLVECDADTDGGDWMVIQKRHDGSVDFYRTWAQYKKGFGVIDREYFLGFDNLVPILNSQGPQELMILMQNNLSVTAYAKFSSFMIGNETEKFVLKSIGTYSGTAGNSLSYHVGYKFSTKDQDNGPLVTENCAVMSWGAWWYSTCYDSNLNGRYGALGFNEKINWNTFTMSRTHLIKVKMMIRKPRRT